MNDGLNFYGYVHANPINRYDPSGHEVVVCYGKLLGLGGAFATTLIVAANSNYYAQVTTRAFTYIWGVLTSAYDDLTTRKRWNHIKGEHAPWSNRGKPKFPADWSWGKIQEAIADVATNPNSKPRPEGRRTIVVGEYDGLEIEVVLGDISIGEPPIISGYPKE